MIKEIVGISLPTLLFSGCHFRSAEGSSGECAPATAPLPAEATAEGLEGTYSLKLVAIAGAKKGAVAYGTLWLQQQDSALLYHDRLGGGRDPTTVLPLFGAADIALGAVDAVPAGSTTSRDPLRPGVLVIQRHAAPGKAPFTEITVRLGADGNQRGRTLFDGPYTALQVQEVSPRRFAGAWRSGTTRERSRGYFCATRVKEGR